MLTKLTEWADCLPIVKKEIDGTDVSHRSSVALGECPEITVEAPRILGASAVVLRICKDGQSDVDHPFAFTDTQQGIDTYKLTLDTRELCEGEDDGLFFYEILFLRGIDTLFTTTENNVDFTLQKYSGRRFSLLVYQQGLKTPDWFKGRVMYQVFVDRFCKGEGAVGQREDVIINEDWENGIPQYAEKCGDPLKNNMFFGGNLWGVIEKLDYLKTLGVGIIYLNPIFKAYSNHKYDTGDYSEIDTMFGGKEAFELLLRKAEEADIKVILDGVFNHTGDNSIYFDRYGEYGGNGAYGNKRSPYRQWYRFKGKAGKEEDFESWWGIKILPRLDHECDECRRFFTDKDGIGARYIREGVAGWRLDVADELSDRFLDEFCAAVKKESRGEAVIIGEVWENAVEKEAYGKRRKYLRGAQLDSVMNYPFRTAVMEYVLKSNGKALGDTLKHIYSVYPKQVCDSLMNLIGTHDTERALTVMGKGTADVTDGLGSVLSVKRLSDRQRSIAQRRLMLVAAIQYTVYGVPSLYYGDEAGVEGYRDPFCRMPYPWGREDKCLLAFYRRLGNIRAEYRELFAHGDFRLLEADGARVVYERTLGKDRILVVGNAAKEKCEYKLRGEYTDLLSGKQYSGAINGYGCVILKKD